MKFSHLVQINDPSNPLIESLSREQLWRGLVLRAENSVLFDIAIDVVRILERSENLLARELQFGRATIRDQVRFEPMQEVRYDTEASADVPAATLVMRIEEPESGQLFVRFEYETLSAGTVPDNEDPYSGYVKNAYLKADVDTIAHIRRFASEGMLQGSRAN